jgi:minimal PKS chain-length factor (CLF/KS beta)
VSNQAKAVITGLGMVAPTGCGTKDCWSAILAGRNALARITRFDPAQYPTRIGGEVPDFDPALYVPSRLMPQTDHMTRLSLAAAAWAMEDAGLDPANLPEYAAGVFTAATAGGYEFGQRELQNLWSKGGKHVSAYQSFAWFYAVNTGQISIRHNLRGPSGAVVSDHAGALDAVAAARRQITDGTPMMITGAVDSAMSPLGWSGHIASGSLSTVEDPDRAYLPFDVAASGHVPGEGGAILVMEDADAAAERGARQVYGEIAGWGATLDPKPGTGGLPGLRPAIEQALQNAGCEPGDVDVVFADAFGTPAADREEAETLAAVFGSRGVPVTAPKTMTGRLASGSGSFDLALALLSLNNDVIPPTVNTSDLAPGIDLDLVVDTPRDARLSTALVVARGHRGFNSAVVVRRAH